MQLVYHSRSRAAGQAPSTPELMRSLLSVASRNNARNGITGFLILDRSRFFQILEGARIRVLGVYERIQKDPRHDDVTLMALRDVSERDFPRWPMGGTIRNVEQMDIFLRHKVGGPLDPATVTAPSIVALARDLQDFDTDRNAALRAAS